MSAHSEKAKNLFIGGYNCAQAVFCAFCDVTHMDREQALHLSSSFGGGMGRLREVCGAFSAMLMVQGMVRGGDMMDIEQKAAQYTAVQTLADCFIAANGALTCRDLLSLPAGRSCPVPEKRSPDYYLKRPCAGYIERAAEILDLWLEEGQ